MLVEDRSDVDAAEEGHEGIYREDPPDRPITILLQLMLGNVGLKGPHGVGHAESREKATPTAKHHKPSRQASFWVHDGVLILRAHRGRLMRSFMWAGE